MSAGERDTLAELITSHEFWEASDILKAMCRGHSPVVTFDGAPFEPQAWNEYAAHLADVLLASDWLREQRTEAWDECCDLHFREGDDPYGPIGSRCDRNPYRKTEDTDAH